jgi:hypothetical protein
MVQKNMHRTTKLNLWIKCANLLHSQERQWPPKGAEKEVLGLPDSPDQDVVNPNDYTDPGTMAGKCTRTCGQWP